MIKPTTIFVLVLILGFDALFSQSGARLINVNDTIVDLNAVDINKGKIIENSKYSIEDSTNTIINYITEIRAYRSVNNNNYALDFYTKTYSRESNFNLKSTNIKYYNINGDLLFEKSFDDLGLFDLYISSTGESVIIDLSSIQSHETHVFDKSGKLIKSYDNRHERLYTGSIHNYFMIFNHSNYRGPNTYDLIDKTGNIKELIFPSGFLTRVVFSPFENYLLIHIDRVQYLFDVSGNLIWKSSIDNGAINFLGNEEFVYSYNHIIKELEIRDFLNNDIVKVIPNIIYENDTLPIEGYLSIDNDLMLSTQTTYKHIFQFVTIDGTILQAVTLPRTANLIRKKVIKENGIFKIILDQSRQ